MPEYTDEEKYDQLHGITADMIRDDIKHFVQDTMVDWGWAEERDGTYFLTPAGEAQLEDLTYDEAPPE